MQSSLKYIMLKKGRVIHDICGNYLPEKVATTISEYKEKSAIEIVLLEEMDKKEHHYMEIITNKETKKTCAFY